MRSTPKVVNDLNGFTSVNELPWQGLAKSTNGCMLAIHPINIRTPETTTYKNVQLSHADVVALRDLLESAALFPVCQSTPRVHGGALVIKYRASESYEAKQVCFSTPEEGERSEKLGRALHPHRG